MDPDEFYQQTDLWDLDFPTPDNGPLPTDLSIAEVRAPDIKTAIPLRATGSDAKSKSDTVTLDEQAGNDPSITVKDEKSESGTEPIRQFDRREDMALPTIVNSPSHSSAGSVIARFTGITGVKPTIRALMELREIFKCTGAITREQKRKWGELAAPFETHRDEILRAMENPVLWQVVGIIILDGRSKPH
jgi:hypothetical protein